MARKKTKSKKKPTSPCYVVELPLATSASEERELADRFLCGTRICNVLLQDGIAIVAALRADPAWAFAREMPVKTEAQRKERQRAFSDLREAYGFGKAEFDARAIMHKNAAGFEGRIGSHETQAVAKRVYKALNEWLLGLRGKPRFKGRQRPLHSLEGKNNASCLRWDAESGVLTVEKGFALHVDLDALRLAKDEWLWSALQAPTKYCRLLWRQVQGERRYFVQLVQKGKAPIKASLLARLAPKDAEGGLDLGPSAVAWATGKAAGLQPLCPSVDRAEAKIRRLQRHIDRQRRAANSDNRRPDGPVRAGRKQWATSKRQAAAQVQLTALHRREAAVRANEHGRLLNHLLSQARHWRHDGVAPRALQKQYGKSVSQRAPGRFMSELTRKAERAGGSCPVIDVRNLKSSQYDHSLNTFIKKALSERWHVFGDGRGRVQRDVYSAFLARNSEGSAYDPPTLERAWRDLASVLAQMGLYVPYQPASATRQGSLPARARGDFAPRQSRSSAKSQRLTSDAAQAADLAAV